MNENFHSVLATDSAIHSFFKETRPIFDGTLKEKILVLCDFPGEVMCNFMESTDVIIAGGGIVFNEKDEILLIHRKGKWDLPKGKIELTETITNGAVREVEEETGVKIKETNEIPVTTYHAYRLNGRDCLKQTEWFVMRAEPGQKELTPQLEEDIDTAKWVSRQDLKTYQSGCYPLVWDILAPYCL